MRRTPTNTQFPDRPTPPAALDLAGVARRHPRHRRGPTSPHPQLLARHGVAALANKGYQGGAGPTIATVFKRRRRLSANQKADNRSLSRARAQGERAAATLKCWKILTNLRC